MYFSDSASTFARVIRTDYDLQVELGVENKRRPLQLPCLRVRLDLKVATAGHFVETTFTLEAAETSVFLSHAFA